MEGEGGSPRGWQHIRRILRPTVGRKSSFLEHEASARDATEFEVEPSPDVAWSRFQHAPT